MSQEEAQAERARRDWKDLGRGGEPSELVLRKPQLASATAKVEAAKESVSKAERDLKRTKVLAPYASRIEETHTELGSFLAMAAPIADVYAVSPFQIELPLSVDDYAFLAPESQGNPKVWMSADVGVRTLEWTGEVIRDTGMIDQESRSVNLVAKVEENDSGFLQPGLFVQAKVEGRKLENIVRVPLKAFYDLDQLIVVDQRNRLQFRKVTVMRRQGNEAIVSEGLAAGERICTTALEAVIEGMEVEIAESEPQDGDGPQDSPKLTETPKT